MPTQENSVGESIRRRRKEAGLSQEELASRADITQSHLSKLERGERPPSIKVYGRIESEINRERGYD